MATANECDGATDTSLTAAQARGGLNGANGNGFDDDCDGLVDEGCSCLMNGAVKDCFLVPATQTDAQGSAVGWCAANAKGSLDCAGSAQLKWSGICRGAVSPAATDSCGPGDFDCDGLAGNSATTGCGCAPDVVCPTSEQLLAPYPTQTALPSIDAASWFPNPATAAQTTDWVWTIVGGDCDNVLPNPSFAIYDRADSTATGSRRGTRTAVRLDSSGRTAKYVADSSSKLVAMQAVNYGTGVTGARVYPAFGLSGDYIVQGEFTLAGNRYSCTQKVQVRAPGIRAELCWDSVGNNDVDLHFARLQGVNCTNKGWLGTCSSTTGIQDCYYQSTSGCASGSPSPPGWGYANSSASACLGWSSKRNPTGTQLCTNPRLDRDSISCTVGQTDPTSTSFCGPENINLDNPNDGDKFVVGVNYYGGTTGAKPHVNLYCNGLRVLSIGYNPATAQLSFPRLVTAGADVDSDFWTVGTIAAHVTGGQLSSCDVATIPSRFADVNRDGPGGTTTCVDTKASNGPTPYTTQRFIESAAQGGTIGGIPTAPGQYCKH